MTPPHSSPTDRLRSGLVIPAHPLALSRTRKLDERRQRALTRYYLAAGAGGLAVGVHTTQFAIRDPRHGLLRPVLELARDVALASEPRPSAPITRPVLIAGVCGRTRQATAEAVLARDLGYDAGLLSLGALSSASERELLAHCRSVSREIPVLGFYLQPAAGGRLLPYSFWRRFVEIPNIVGIKIAPFNRYQTLDVVRAVAESGRAAELALYTGNDDHILTDLVTQFEWPTSGMRPVQISMAGGLLGQWACWTRTAVDLLTQAKAIRRRASVPASFLSLSEHLTDANAAIFDVAHAFAGCIAGIHYVLARQGLLAGTWCLDPNEGLSPGQAREIDRVSRAYPHLTDDAFVRQHLDDWLRD
ncbi:MAG: hypothetical protein JNK85_17235 [Verrucomicrobiales bacterium]|nr:hypothetical protein [Verrucomicrobiales bacterium]